MLNVPKMTLFQKSRIDWDLRKLDKNRKEKSFFLQRSITSSPYLLLVVYFAEIVKWKMTILKKLFSQMAFYLKRLEKK